MGSPSCGVTGAGTVRFRGLGRGQSVGSPGQRIAKSRHTVNRYLQKHASFEMWDNRWNHEPCQYFEAC